LKSKNAIIGLIIICLVISAILIIIFSPPQQGPSQPNRGPEISIISPEASSTVFGVVSIEVEIIDEENLTADVFIDGSLKASTESYMWNTSTYPDGRHSIRVQTEDSDGLRDRRSIEVKVDNVEDIVEPFDGLFKIMLYNIKESGINNGWKTIVKNENPELLVLVETGFFDDNSNERLNAAVSEFNAHFANETLYDAYCAQNVVYSTTGEAILSRFPIQSFTQIQSVKLDDGSTYDVTHDFIYAVVDINGTEVHVFGGHLKASEGDNNQWRREREMEGIINYMDDLGDVPILYLSDQNSFSPFDIGELSPNGLDLGYGPMTMMLIPDDPTFGNYSSEVHNFTDVYRKLNPFYPGYTYGHQVVDTTIRIDYVVVNQFFEDKLLNSTTVTAPPSDSASDHYAVTTFLQWNLTISDAFKSLSCSNSEKTNNHRNGVILSSAIQLQILELNLLELIRHPHPSHHMQVREE
jgi:endonuclease/exonuclease/phosphatase family metal-dependent hydrolase